MNDPAYDAVSLQLTKALHKSTLGNSTDGALNFLRTVVSLRSVDGG
jgi:hypothetical protein